MNYTNLNDEQISTILNKIEKNLLSQQKLPFTYEINWKDNFPDEPGIYAAFEKNKLIYVGQTADLRSRMSDIRRTYNHTLRKKIGVLRLKARLEKNKFSDNKEQELTKYMVENLSFTHMPISFGRLEVEFELVQKHRDALLNSISVRGVKKRK